jgi:hypothetical protein
MRVRYLRNEPGKKENLAAALVSGTLAAGVGLVTFYFVRLLLSREAVGDPEDRELLPSSSAEE